MSLDSPASPDMDAATVTGSPVRIIPASPPPKSAEESSRDEDTAGEEQEEEEEDDIDEDILYLRLIALRSMAAEGEQRERTKEKQEELAKEMQELLDEAEEAASYDLMQNAGKLRNLIGKKMSFLKVLVSKFYSRA
jgi:hypothetical protein